MPDKQDFHLNTLLDLLRLMEREDDAEAVRFNNGYRTFILTCRELLDSIGGCAGHFDHLGLTPGDRVILWGENRPEWIIAFWACLARGLQVVPVDAASSPRRLKDIADRTSPRLLVYSEELDAAEIDLPALSFFEIRRLPPCKSINPVSASPEDIVEIVFTSGTTGKPRGVVHTHRNICSDLQPVAGEIASFSRYLKYFKPVRVLTMLPFSHMFGQFLGLFIPIMLQGAAVLTNEINPGRLIDLARKEKSLALVTVPGFLDSLRQRVEDSHNCTARIRELPGVWGFIRRWIRFRDVHLRFGWRCLALVSGGALLRPSLERWWSQLGFLVIQGYGLTEASPVVAMNNPARLRSGSLGRVLEGQQVKIAADGEILVRGDNVAEYFDAEEPVSSDGWLHTGDIGRIDEEGNLYFLGRKKDLIVTSDGHNVYPEDIEARLDELPEVSSSAVVAKETEKGPEVHAVLLLSGEGGDPAKLVQQANNQLESHQRIRGWTVWPEPDLPRTESTGKIRRGQVADVVNQIPARNGSQEKEQATTPTLENILARFTSLDPGDFSDRQRLAEDLGIGSLDRIELLGTLEAKLGLELDEESLSRPATIGDLKNLPGARGSKPSPVREPLNEETSSEPAVASLQEALQEPVEALQRPSPPKEKSPRLKLPRWSNTRAAGLLRFLARELLTRPALKILLRISVAGKENLQGLQSPVIFAANHTSHLDVPVLVSALPFRWRGSPAPAMLQDFFSPLLEPRKHGLPLRASARLAYSMACLLFRAYPFPQETGGIRRALEFSGQLADLGGSPLVFPEGRRTDNGRIQEFRPGVGHMARKLDLPVVPVRIRGLFSILPRHRHLPRPGKVSVAFGEPLHWSPDRSDSAFASELRRRIGSL